MKPFLFSIIFLLGFGFLFSCKNDHNKSVDAATDVIDTLSTEPTTRYKYVTAVSGLTLRELPNLQSNKLVVMPLGTKVKLVYTDGNTTMNVGGIDGAMDEIEFNNQKGFAFNGYLSKFPPSGAHAVAKNYIEELKKEFPTVEYSETIGGTASRPTKTQTLILPTEKWHEAFFMAQQLFDIPNGFAFPNPSGAKNEIQKNSEKKKTDFISELRINRNNDELQKISYHHKTTGFGYTVTISRATTGMKIERLDVAD